MEEEFQESEVIFPENFPNNEENVDINGGFSNDDLNSRRNNKPKRRKKKNSIPVNIPETIVSGNSWFNRCVDSDFFDDDGGGEMVPPHMVVGRRIYAGKVAFSVCTGNGRTLKGRDLSEVRDSILRMTGFLES